MAHLRWQTLDLCSLPLSLPFVRLLYHTFTFHSVLLTSIHSIRVPRHNTRPCKLTFGWYGIVYVIYIQYIRHVSSSHTFIHYFYIDNCLLLLQCYLRNLSKYIVVHLIKVEILAIAFIAYYFVYKQAWCHVCW